MTVSIGVAVIVIGVLFVLVYTHEGLSLLQNRKQRNEQRARWNDDDSNGAPK